jgi:polyisoprenyl-teichoic acid--peptidoglycan teichoic acid transferase
VVGCTPAAFRARLYRARRRLAANLGEFFNGGKLSLVAWKTSGAAYWISNTLTDSIPTGQLVAMAASLQPAR